MVYPTQVKRCRLESNVWLYGNNFIVGGCFCRSAVGAEKSKGGGGVQHLYLVSGTFTCLPCFRYLLVYNTMGPCCRCYSLTYITGMSYLAAVKVGHRMIGKEMKLFARYYTLEILSCWPQAALSGTSNGVYFMDVDVFAGCAVSRPLSRSKQGLCL